MFGDMDLSMEGMRKPGLRIFMGHTGYKETWLLQTKSQCNEEQESTPVDDIKERGQIAPRWGQRRREGKENFCDGPREACRMGLARQGSLSSLVVLRDSDMPLLP